jgi:hypothetical protein
MCSCSKNPIHKRAIEMNLEKRKQGETGIIDLGPETYMNAVTEVLLGYKLGRHTQMSNIDLLRNLINESPYLETYREQQHCNTMTYQGPELKFDRGEMYDYSQVVHWRLY